LPTPQAIGQIIDNLRANGYTFVTISELLEYYEVRETGLFSYLQKNIYSQKRMYEENIELTIYSGLNYMFKGGDYYARS
jgi:hypothetical protein